MKKNRFRHKKYYEYVSFRPCLFCGKTPDSPAHHVRWAGLCGTSLKPSNLLVIPACSDCHDAIHNMIGKRYREIVSKVGREEILQCMLTQLVEWLELDI